MTLSLLLPLALLFQAAIALIQYYLGLIIAIFFFCRHSSLTHFYREIYCLNFISGTSWILSGCLLSFYFSLKFHYCTLTSSYYQTNSWMLFYQNLLMCYFPLLFLLYVMPLIDFLLLCSLSAIISTMCITWRQYHVFLAQTSFLLSKIYPFNLIMHTQLCLILTHACMQHVSICQLQCTHTLMHTLLLFFAAFQFLAILQ